MPPATLTVGDVLQVARDLHPALSETNAPSDLGFRVVGRLQRLMYDAVVDRIPAYLSQVFTVAMPLADFEAGITLSDYLPNGWKDLMEGFCHYGDQPTTKQFRMKSVPWGQRDMPQPFPAYTFRNDIVYLLGSADDWSQVDTLSFYYTGIPEDPEDAEDVLSVPIDARDALAAKVAAFYAGRLMGQPQWNMDQTQVQKLEMEAQAAWDAWLSRITRLGQRQRYRVRDVR